MKIYNLDTSQIGNHEDLSKKHAGEGGTVRKAIDSCLNGCKDENEQR